MSNNSDLWQRYQNSLCHCPEIGLSLDFSRMKIDDGFFAEMETAIQDAFSEMRVLEKGSIANKDEGRMVGHYWLRNPSLSPLRGRRNGRGNLSQAVRLLRRCAPRNDIFGVLPLNDIFVSGARYLCHRREKLLL